MTQDIEKRLPPHAPTLLRLPPQLRHRIYLLIGVARRDGTDRRPYTYYLDGGKDPRRFVSADDPPPGRNFTGLLLSCRALYAEVATLLYSANRFVIFYSDSHHASLGRFARLDPLHALSPTALAALTSLKIVLNQSSCHGPIESTEYPPGCCCDDVEDKPRANSLRFHCAKYHGSLHRRPLLDSISSGKDPSDSTSSKPAAQAILAAWHDTAVYLSSHVSAGCLALSLVCDIDHQHEYALEAARLAVAPLALFSPLKDCHVRLGKQLNRPLQRLAESAVLQARANASPLRLAPAKIHVPSPLTKLPLELRLHILEYTDLITPWSEVTWSRHYRLYQVGHPPCLLSEGGCPPHIHHGCRLSKCMPIESHDSSLPPSPGCFCRRRHAAFSFTCNCWAPPTSLFLVCRALYRDAQFVFFSGNRFVVYDLHATFACSALPPIQCEPWNPETTNSDKYYPFERLTASYFLRDAVPADCLAHLRFLELVFPPYVPHGWPVEKHPAILDWRDTVIWLRGKVNAPALTIRVVFADFQVQVIGRQSVSRDQGNQIVKGYIHILQAFRYLVKDDGLAALYVQAAYPWSWSSKNPRLRPLFGDNWLDEEERRLKEFCERMPGCEAIVDSRTKPEPRESIWQRWYDADYY